MGWFIGISGVNQTLKQKVLELSPEPVFQVNKSSLFLCAGGLESTLFHHKENKNSGWVVSGIGITKSPKPRLLNKTGWSDQLEHHNSNIDQLNGHFALIRWTEQELEFFTDQLGIRNIYFFQDEDCTLFSTRLDWILKLASDSPINWGKFGSRWLSINQFSSESFISGIERLSQGGKASLRDNKLVITNKRFDYSQNSTTPSGFIDELHAFTTLPLNEDRTLSLGLSGGLDSRTLFATLLKTPDLDWGLHSFGEREHPDMKIAQQLNSSYGRNHYIFNEEIPGAETLSTKIPDYIGQTLFTSSPSHLVGFQAYQKLASRQLSVVDGGFGEIARRRFMVSIMLREQKAVEEKNVAALLPYLRQNRADIFTNECTQMMEEGMKAELYNEINAMPSVDSLGFENWLDLFTIRTRVPNAAGPEQARSDSYLFNYMPFLQPQLVRTALNLPLKYRKNATLFRELINDTAPELMKYPLVKGSVTYPYWMKDLSSAIYMRLKKNIGYEYSSNRDSDFLYRIEDYVRDLFSSRSAKEFGAYDFRKVDKLISGFYDEKNMALSSNLNWLVAFEVFRKLNDAN